MKTKATGPIVMEQKGVAKSTCKSHIHYAKL